MTTKRNAYLDTVSGEKKNAPKDIIETTDKFVIQTTK